jgi:hypothetical protein
MIELKNDGLVLSFPEVHPEAVLQIDFQRTLRIPDDDTDHALPPGLGRFPLRHLDDFAARAPDPWLARGGVLLPMYQSEAMWLNFSARGGYPFAVKIATGKVNAVTGEGWDDGLHRRPQDYVVVPDQPWLDGYAVEKGIIRQFVAMPLGSGYSAEEQITGRAEHGGLQLVAYPMKAQAYKKLFRRTEARYSNLDMLCSSAVACSPAMGLAPGGRMRQEIYDDPHSLDVWDTRHRSRCFVHLVNSLVWRAITDEDPPTVPPTAKEYTEAGLPWFDFYGGDRKALEGGEELRKLRSVLQIGKAKGDVPLPENEPVTPERVIQLRRGLRKDQVREGRF